MLKGIKIIILLFFSLQSYTQGFVNDGAKIMLQTDALIFSEEKFLNINNGQIQGNGKLSFSSLNNKALVNPGHNIDISKLNVIANLENTTTSICNMSIQGTIGIGVENGNGHLFVDGDLSLDGKLEIDTIDAFVPEQTDVFVLMTYTRNLFGQFSSVVLGSNLSGFEVDYSINGQIRLLYTGALSVKDEITIERLHIYPNPTSNYIYLSASQKIDKIEVYDLLGKQVLSTNQTEKVNLDKLSEGLYLVKIYSEDQFQTKKINLRL